ncbi:leucyl/phenylalanyl-tRNA--protein transferase [Kitasatospora sp. McL0602]|uniref:leucyl/phenylalanyl-tRNA--protein transferase n=1 Tax=Kitasatospora sp. McL0602 TaxID=3439530 RepID=UPI003F8C8552
MEARHRSWSSVDLSTAPGDTPAVFCADLSPAGLLAGYQAGAFPLPTPDDYARYLTEARCEEDVAAGRIAVVGTAVEVPYEVAWWSPDPRPVIAPSGGILGRRLARRLRNTVRWSTTVDREFARVVEECRAGRSPRWLTDQLKQGLCGLHEEGHAHSVEVWEDGELIGGAFGVQIGAVLSLDSMFHRRSDAARVAIADLATRFTEAGGQLLDVQWDGPAVRALGSTLTPRAAYLDLLHSPHDSPTLPLGLRPAGRTCATHQ